jgi:hypothetical protein
VLQKARGRRKDEIGRGGADDQKVDVGRFETGRIERGASGVLGEIGRRFAFGGDVALADAGARLDPLVARFDEFFEIGVGQDFLRQIAAGPGDA